jgi:hypothetical protein
MTQFSMFEITSGDCPKTVLNTINITYIRNVLTVIQAKFGLKNMSYNPNMVIVLKTVLGQFPQTCIVTFSKKEICYKLGCG